jgi:type II secretory pathway pseudopilin PulG
MTEKQAGFSTTELLVVILIMGGVAAFSLPSALNAVKGYRLHADAAVISTYLNLAQMKAASQYAPYRLVVNVAAGTYMLEKLCGTTPSSVDSSCTTPFSPFTTRQFDGGTQYAFQGNTFASCRPSGITVYPGTITGDPSPCADPFYVYFNTRGTPVNSSGGPVGNGGAALYIQNENALVDAVTASPAGRVSVWTWKLAGTLWASR